MLTDKKLFLFDMDGTLYLGDDLFPGSAELLAHIRECGSAYCFLTNNSSKGVDSYIEKLRRMGIEACSSDFVTSANAAIDRLKQKYPPDTAYYVCGTRSLIKQFEDAGLVCKSAEDASVLVLAYDTELTYQKIEDCCKMLARGADYIATHPDLVCPVSFGYVPDCGSFIQMLENASGRRPDEIIGKPKPQMVYTAMKRFDASKQQTCLIGDRIYTDIACGCNAGIDTVFVLSGEGRMEDIEKYNIHPTYIFDNVEALLSSMVQKSI